MSLRSSVVFLQKTFELLFIVFLLWAGAKLALCLGFGSAGSFIAFLSALLHAALFKCGAAILRNALQNDYRVLSKLFFVVFGILIANGLVEFAQLCHDSRLFVYLSLINVEVAPPELLALIKELRDMEINSQFIEVFVPHLSGLLSFVLAALFYKAAKTADDQVKLESLLCHLKEEKELTV